MVFLLCKFMVLLVVVVLQCEAIKEELLAVFTIFRHGDRNPVMFYPKDPYQYSPSLWTAGLGELNNQGKERHFELGKWFRKRYENFLPIEYSPKDIYIRSSDVDRSIMSAGAHLAALYPPKKGQLWNSALPWQPIPIHTVPFAEDNLASMAKPCSKHAKLQDELLQTEEFRTIAELNEDMFLYLSKNTGMDVTSFRECALLYDILFIEEDRKNLTLPKWTRPVYPERLRDTTILFMLLDTYTPEMARLKAGPLLDAINSNFNKIAANASDPEARKYFILSAHDVTIVNVLNALNIYKPDIPMYASSLIFELRRGGKGRKFVNLLYKKDTDPETQPEPIRLSLNGCKFNCLLDTFSELIKPMSISQSKWEQECQST